MPLLAVAIFLFQQQAAVRVADLISVTAAGTFVAALLGPLFFLGGLGQLIKPTSKGDFSSGLVLVTLALIPFAWLAYLYWRGQFSSAAFLLGLAPSAVFIAAAGIAGMREKAQRAI